MSRLYPRLLQTRHLFWGGSLGRGIREDIKKMPLMQPTAFGWGCEWGKYGRCRSGGFPIRIGECSRKGTMGTTGLCLSSWWQRDTTCACHLTSLNCTYGTRHVTKCYCSAGLTTTGVYYAAGACQFTKTLQKKLLAIAGIRPDSANAAVMCLVFCK